MYYALPVEYYPHDPMLTTKYLGTAITNKVH
jgi:hypothetical protein